MATLRLNVHSADFSSSFGLVAELRTVGDDGRSRLTRKFEVIPGNEHPIEDLAPGTWEVRVLPPAGPMVSGEIELAAGDDERLTLQVAQGRTTRPVRRSSSSENISAQPILPDDSFFLSLLILDDTYRDSVQVIEDKIDDMRATTLLVKPYISAEIGDVVQRWRSLARCVDGKITPRKALTARETGAATHSLFSEPAEVRFDKIARYDRRVFTMVEYAKRRRLHSIPYPFRTQTSDGVCLRIYFDKDGDLRSRVELSEATYAGIVAYLATGAVVAAAELAKNITRDLTELALRDKRSSPLGACAAAYVMIGSRDLAPYAPWHDWLGNLRQWFPEVPDGALLEARLRLLKASTNEQVEEVAGLLREAVTRGLPFYAVGIGWLVQSLRHFPNDALLAKVLPWVERVAASVDMDEPFTTLRIGDDR